MNFSIFRPLALTLSLPVSVALLISTPAMAGFDFENDSSRAQAVPISIMNADIKSEKEWRAETQKPKLHIYSKDTHQDVPVATPTSKEFYPAHVPLAPYNYAGFKHTNVETWKASEGESLRDVIMRWSDRADVEFVWAVEDQRVVLDSISYFGNFESALMHLFDKGMDGTVEGELAYTDSTAPVPASPVSIKQETKVVSVDHFALDKQQRAPAVEILQPAPVEFKWKASPRETLESVLSRWETQGEYELVWDYPYDVPVPNAFYAYGSLEDAVGMLLDQFTQTNMRPVGNLYKDPHSGKKYLYIKGNI